MLQHCLLGSKHSRTISSCLSNKDNLKPTAQLLFSRFGRLEALQEPSWQLEEQKPRFRAANPLLLSMLYFCSAEQNLSFPPSSGFQNKFGRRCWAWRGSRCPRLVLLSHQDTSRLIATKSFSLILFNVLRSSEKVHLPSGIQRKQNIEFFTLAKLCPFPYLKTVALLRQILTNCLPVERLVFLFASNWHSYLTGNTHWILPCFCWQMLGYPYWNLPTSFLVSK